MFPQSYSTDRRYGRLSLKAIGLFPLMWANADDQGRLCGDPEEIKYAVCPNIDHITKHDIPALLLELQQNDLILCYESPKSPAIQLLDWWDANHRMQWSWPSQYLPPEGWVDHLRYKKDAKTVFTQNWPISGESSGETDTMSQASTAEYPGESTGETDTMSQASTVEPSGESSGESSGEFSGEFSGETPRPPPLTTPSTQNERGRERGRGRGSSPEDSGENSSPSPTADENKITSALLESFSHEWGRVPAGEPEKVIERVPDAKERAQLRDLGEELSRRGGVPLDYIRQAFGEAAGATKFHISYVRAVLLDWMRYSRNPP